MNCEYCNTPLNEDNHHYFDGTSMCSDCHDERVTICDDCGREVWTEDNSGCSQTFLCQDCYDNHYNSCEACGRTIHHDDCYYLDDDDVDAYCHECYNERHNSYIESYNYRPAPEFYGQSNCYLGVELEIDKGSHGEQTAKTLHQIANKNNEKNEYYTELKSFACFQGYHPEDVDAWIEEGFELEDIENFLYCEAN